MGWTQGIKPIHPSPLRARMDKSPATSHWQPEARQDQEALWLVYVGTGHCTLLFAQFPWMSCFIACIVSLDGTDGLQILMSFVPIFVSDYSIPVPVFCFFPLFFAGMMVWTLMEYGIHRYIFHMNPPASNYFLITLHFMLHGQHHKVRMVGGGVTSTSIDIKGSVNTKLLWQLWMDGPLPTYLWESSSHQNFCPGSEISPPLQAF